MPKRIPPEAFEYLRMLGKRFGAQGGKSATANMAAEERSDRAKKASAAAAKKRTEERLARERQRKSAPRRNPKRG
jgi:hypothetical protein